MPGRFEVPKFPAWRSQLGETEIGGKKKAIVSIHRSLEDRVGTGNYLCAGKPWGNFENRSYLWPWASRNSMEIKQVTSEDKIYEDQVF